MSKNKIIGGMVLLVALCCILVVKEHNSIIRTESALIVQEIDADSASLKRYEVQLDSVVNIVNKSFSMPRNEPEDICCVELDSTIRRRARLDYKVRFIRKKIGVLDSIKERYNERLVLDL